MILSVLLFGCKQRKNAAEYIRELNTSDTFRYEFTVNENGEFDSTEYFFKKRFEDFIKLPSLEKGFDSIQLRIAYSCAMGNDMLVIISNANNKWIAEVSKLNDYFSDGADKRGIPRNSLFPTPKSGWKKFIARLFELKILSLEDNQRIPGFFYPTPSDGCGVHIEVATKNTYRFYRYDNPDMYSHKFWQARNVLSILRLINEELSIKTNWPSPKKNDKEEPGVKHIKIDEIPLKDIDSIKD